MRKNLKSMLRSSLDVVVQLEQGARLRPHEGMVRVVGGLKRKVNSTGKWLWERIFEKIQFNDGHWLWMGRLDVNGYGKTSINRIEFYAHSVVYEGLIGDCPEGLELDHLCRIRNCVNPYHLEPVTHRMNILRGKTVPAAHAIKTHCPLGHPYEGSNLSIHLSTGGRRCKACDRIRHKENYGVHRQEKLIRQLVYEI